MGLEKYRLPCRVSVRPKFRHISQLLQGANNNSAQQKAAFCMPMIYHDPTTCPPHLAKTIISSFRQSAGSLPPYFWFLRLSSPESLPRPGLYACLSCDLAQYELPTPQAIYQVSQELWSVACDVGFINVFNSSILGVTFALCLLLQPRPLSHLEAVRF